MNTPLLALGLVAATGVAMARRATLARVARTMMEH
jgi:hypothetical protein